MKKIKLLFLIAFIPRIIFGQVINEECVYCKGNTVNFTNGASAIGTSNISTGINSISSGFQNEASGSYSYAVGYQNIAFGSHSIAMGKTASAYGIQSLAIGLLSEALGNASMAVGAYTKTSEAALLSIAFGSRVTALAERSMTIGFGISDNPIENSISNSLMVGFESNLPTLFIGPSGGMGKTGKVGIGNVTSPNAKLHIRADADSMATLRLEPGGSNVSRIYFSNTNDYYIQAATDQNMIFRTPSSKNFNFENGKVGIGVTSPTEKLEVTGYTKTSSGYKVGTNIVINASRDYSGRNGAFSGNLTVTGTGNSSFVGNVGIGTTTPAERLEVAGWAKTSNGYKVGTSPVIDINRNFSGNNGTFSGNFAVTGTSTLNGNVGIGTNPTSNKLSVNGTVQATSFLGNGAGLTNVPGDNLGNHTATQNIKLSGLWLSGDGGDEGIFINNDGKVGIGTATPSGLLSLNKNDTTENLGMSFQNSGSTKYWIGHNHVSNFFYFGGTGVTVPSSGAINVIYNGAVGIGTTTPSSELDVKGTTTLDYNKGNMSGNALVVKSEEDQLKILDRGTGYYGVIGNQAEKTYIKAYSNNGIEGAAIFLNKNGNVGIGVTNPMPDYKLSVAGKILAEELQIQLVQDWYDNVFKAEYNLMDLNELESYVKQNNHLPDVPSEAEVMENGIRVGEMNALLLKKVEELTLYVIEQQKMLEYQHTEIENLKQLFTSKNNQKN